MGASDELTFIMWTTRDIGTPASVRGFLRALETAGNEWRPARFGEYEPLRKELAKDGPAGFAKAWLGSDPAAADLIFTLSRAVRGRGAIHWARRPHHRFNSLSVSLDAVSAEMRADELFIVARALFDAFDGAYGRIYGGADFQSQHLDPASGRLLGQGFGPHVPGLYWGNFFGTVLVKFLGEQRIATCPCTRRESLAGGRWMLLFGERPWQWDDPAIRHLRESARKHLGEDIFFDLRFLERPTRSPAYDFSEVKVIGDSSPPNGEDWVERFFKDRASAQEFLRGIPLLAGGLGDRLGVRLDLSAGSLAAIDRAISHGETNRVASNDDILAVAAYFGEVVRRTIGGEWSVDAKDARMPVLRLPNGDVEYPVVRALKVFSRESSLSDWHEFLRRGGAGLLRQP